jgi:hypothetical protein
MSLNLRIVILICGISFSVAIIRLLINKKFSERITLIWLISAMVVFVISIFPKVLDVFASILGVDYPPSIMFLLTILILLFICFYHSIQISILNNQVREITQNMVVKEANPVEDINFKLCDKNIENIEKKLIEEENKINNNDVDDIDLKFYNIKRFENDLIEEEHEINEKNEEDIDLKLYHIKSLKMI